MVNQTTTSYVTNTNAMPQWWQDVYGPLLSQAQGQASQPYQPYGGERNAAFTPDQNASFDQIRGLSGVGQNQYGVADSIAGSIRDAGNPYFSAARQGIQNSGQAINTDFAGAAGAGNGNINQAVSGLQSAGDRNTWGVAQPYLDQGAGYLQQGAGGNTLGIAQPYYDQSLAPTGIAAASPYMGMAAQSFTGNNVNQYLNPYDDAVNGRLAQLAGRNLSENLLPQISDQFVRAGQYGSPQQRDLIGRTLRDTQESLLAQQSQNLQQGYGQAGQLFNQDASRYAQLAGTAGGLGQNQQQLYQNAGQGLAGIGGQDYSRQLAGGSALGQFGLGLSGAQATDASRALQAAQGIGSLGVQQGQLGLQTAQAQAQQAEANRQAQYQSGLGMQNLGIAGGNYLTNAANLNMQVGNNNYNNSANTAMLQNQIGGQQQQYNQNNLNTAYGDFQNQQNYPWQQLGNVANLANGLPVNMSGTSQTQTTQPGPSTAGQIAGVGTGLLGLSRAGFFKAGGKVKSQGYGKMPKLGIGALAA